VPGAIKFDDQRTFWTIEIDNVWTNAVLTAELLAEKLAFLKVCPQDGLRCGSFITELFPPVFLFRVVVNAARAVSHTIAGRCKQGTSLTTPSARSNDVDRAATPPLEEGTIGFLKFSSRIQIIASSKKSRFRAKRENNSGEASTVSNLPVRMSSDISLPVAGDSIRPCPLNPAAT